METWRIVVLIVILLVTALGMWYLVRVLLEESKKRTWVYPKTGNRYVPIGLCKMKNPATREWVIAVIYKSEDDKVSVRERQDFLDKFVKLTDWETGKNSG